MAGKPYLVDAGAYNKEVAATQTSAGVANANEIVALNAAGVLDVTLLPPGVTPLVQPAIASEAIDAGDFVNLWNDSGTLKARKADASTPTVGKPADGFVRDNALLGATVNVYNTDYNDQLSALTIGADYFLSDVSPGGIITPAPTTSGHIAQYLGKAVSATKMLIEIERPVLKA